MAEVCPPTAPTTSHRVARVIDADTVELSQGERVRLLGIDAPELGYSGQTDEPFAREGKQALEAILRRSDYRIRLMPGQESRDRYGRQLAYLFLPDQTNIQRLLIQDGWVMQVFVAPNLEFADCLRPVEVVAKTQRKGIWSLAEYQSGIASVAVPDSTRGATLVHGRVVRVGQGKENLWLNLQGGVAIQVPRRYLENFSPRLDELTGQVVRARGWLVREDSRYHQWRMRIDDGRALDLLN
ncbi:thermonuclease family protein [Nitrincola sp. A-D6]|uniref:thermonuclease family protein n=1 Tax=Nitrincola sp. A-D6 TaxID=1545442 RepID=UPI001362C213|nr:thermonuclease family protein [Nitrincola sp. A-D6]